MKKRPRVCLIAVLLVSQVNSFLLAPITFRFRPSAASAVRSSRASSASTSPLSLSSSDEQDNINSSANTDPFSELGQYDPARELRRKDINVGDPQIKLEEKDMTVSDILRELAAIQQEGPQKYCILGTRHCSYLHEQLIELLAYALVLSGNHVYTSGAGGTNAAAVRGALRAEDPDLLTVVLPQSMEKQTAESQDLLNKVEDIIAFPERDEMSLDKASQLCNSYLLKQTDQLISFAFHESNTVIEAAQEAKELKKLVTMLYLD